MPEAPYRRAVTGASARAALGVGLPLLVGVLADQRSLGVVAALGGFWAITQDGLDVHRSRLGRVLAVAFAHSAGLTCGLLVLREAGRGWPVVVALAVAALVGGAVQGTTPARTAAGMHVVLGTVIGTGIDLPGPWWEPPAALLAGSLLVAATSAVPLLLRRRRHERLSLAHAYGWASIGLAAGDDDGEDGDRVKGQLVLALNQAQDVLGPTSRGHGIDDLRDGLAEVVQLGELVTVARVRRTTVPREVRDALLAVRTHLRSGRGRTPVADARAENRERLRGVDSADPVTARVVALLTQDPARPGAELVPRRRQQGLPTSERARFAVLLAATVAVAGWLAMLASGGGYWIPLTVAFVMRPDLGPVFVRAVARGTGTVAGVALTAVAVLLLDDVVGLLVLVTVAAALLPTAQRRGYVWQVLVLTPIVFVFLDVLGEGDSLLVARVLDTVVGVLLVLAVDLLLRSQSPSSRTASQVVFAERAAELYAQRGPAAEPGERHALRRDAYRALTRARRSVDLARREPLRSRRPADDLGARLDEIERAVDVATAEVAVGPVG
ncbi:MAG: FUSC family protein [Nocardioidaceae bacterium]|nr:FUSC family protein [Nocardioidaceae bacterium]